MSDVTTNETTVQESTPDRDEQIVVNGPPTMAEQSAQAAEITAEQQAEFTAEAQKELSQVVKCLKAGNRENAVSQYLAGLHALRFINLCRKAGKSRAFATGELESKLSWWLSRTVDANLLLRTYAAINRLHGDLEPPASKASKEEKAAWAELVDNLPPVGHFHKAWSQLVERVEVDNEEQWVLQPGFEDKCRELYQSAQAKGLKLDDNKDGSKVLEKGITTLTREHAIAYLAFKSDKASKEAAKLSEAKEEAQGAAKVLEDKATAQQGVVKSLLEQSKEAATPEEKAKLEAAAKEAERELAESRKAMRAMIDQAAEKARLEKLADQEALEAAKKAEKLEARAEKKQRAGETDEGRNLPWQAMGENAAAQCSAKDLAEALAGIVAKASEPEDVLFAMLKLQAKDGSNAFKQAVAAFTMTWTRKTAQVA